MKSLFVCLLLFLSSLSSAQSVDTSESWFVEAGINIAQQSSLSISIEKEFVVGKLHFGPRLEIANLFDTIQYRAEGVDTLLTQRAQVRLRLWQFEWEVTDKIRIGVAPFWMLGPIPRRGFYRTPSSVWAHFDLDPQKTLSLAVTLTTSSDQLSQLSLRKRF